MPERPSSPWKLPVLAPLWVIQVALAILFLIGIPVVRTYQRDYYRDYTYIDVPTILIVAVTIIIILLVLAEVVLFQKHKLATRTYLISQWAKATMMGAVWVTLVMLTYTKVSWSYLGEFAMTEFVFQHPTVIASLYYGSRAYSKYGGDAGANNGSGEVTTIDEETPLLRESSEDA